MIFQLSERERFRIAPKVQLRFSTPRVVKTASPQEVQPQRDPGYRPLNTASTPEPVPLRPMSYCEMEVAAGEKEPTRPFEDCEKYEAQGGCQTVLHQRYEGNRGDIMRCTTCGRTFSARRGGITFRSRLSPDLMKQVVERHRRGDSIRKTSKDLDLNRGTVRRYYRLLEEGSPIDEGGY